MSLTLEQLDGQIWPDPDYDSHLVTTVHRLRKKPLDQFTVEDLRIMLGQNFSAEHLLPLALDALERNPLAEGDFYPGDLFKNVVGQPEEFWQDHPELAQRTVGAARGVIEHIHRQWTERAREAWRLYGARSDSRSVSYSLERELIELAEQFISVVRSS